MAPVRGWGGARAPSGLLLVVSLGVTSGLAACGDRELLVFEAGVGGQDDGSTGGGGDGQGGGWQSGDVRSGGGGSSGGTSALGGDAGAASAERLVHLLDTFDDGNTLSNEPGGWWYIINDGAGQQELTVVQGPGCPEHGFCLRTVGSNFEGWGAALGVGIEGFYERGPYDTVRFSARVGTPRDVSFQMLTRSGPRFIRSLEVGTEWTEYSLRLDRETVNVDGETVRLDVADLYELQWFFFVPEPFEFWIDDVMFLRED